MKKSGAANFFLAFQVMAIPIIARLRKGDIEMPLWNSLRIAIGFLYLAPAIFPMPILQTIQVAGVWFSEITQEKSIYYFAGSGGGDGIRVIVLDGAGNARAIACEMREEHSAGKEKDVSCSASFPGEDIMILRSLLFPSPIVLKRVNDPRLVLEVEELMARWGNELLTPAADGVDRRALAAEIKGSISWDLLHMSVGEFLGWLAKQERMDEEKKMREGGQEIKFPIRHHEDIHGLAMIKGRWQFNEKRIFVFSDAPAGEALGVKLYRMEMVNRPGFEGYEPAYTVLVHEEDQRSYLHIAFWQFEFQAPIHIEFQSPDRLLTFKEGRPDAEAIRID